MSIIPWEEKGCKKCRQGWLIGDPPLKVADGKETFYSFHRCQ